jgi:hypothetical protein
MVLLNCYMILILNYIPEKILLHDCYMIFENIKCIGKKGDMYRFLS